MDKNILTHDAMASIREMVAEQIESSLSNMSARMDRLEERLGRLEDASNKAGLEFDLKLIKEVSKLDDRADRQTDLIRDDIQKMAERYAKLQGMLEALTDALCTNNRVVMELVHQVGVAEKLGLVPPNPPTMRIAPDA